MASADVKLDVIAYGGAIAACREQWQAAVALVEQMQSEQVEPNIIIYNSLLKACVKSQQWQVASKTLKVLRFRWPCAALMLFPVVFNLMSTPLPRHWRH